MSARVIKSKYLTKNSVVIDVGAHDGSDVTKFHRKHPCNIYAIEPCKWAFEKLTKLTSDKILIYNIAMTGRDGRAIYYDFSCPTASSTGRGEGNSMFPRHKTQSNLKLITKYNVDTISLESFLHNYCLFSFIDVLFLDCEGSELGIITEISHNKELSNKLGQIIIEFHPQIYGKHTKDFLVDELLLTHDMFYQRGHKDRSFILKGTGK